jgi:hypothetical protein
MNRRVIPLKSRVRYEGRVKTFDRRATVGADLEKLPNPIWRTVGMVLRSQMTEVVGKQMAKKKSTETSAPNKPINSAPSDK